MLAVAFSLRHSPLMALGRCFYENVLTNVMVSQVREVNTSRCGQVPEGITGISSMRDIGMVLDLLG